MTASRREMLLAIPASALIPALAAAQPVAQPGQPGAMPPVAKDPLFAPCLLIGGRKQIENCSFALAKLQSDGCKAFAKAEIEEHETIKKNLKAQGYDYPVTPAGKPQPGQPPAWVVTAGPAKPSPDAAGMIALDHEVAEQCVANYRKEMGKLSGNELDKRFVGNQLDTHMTLLDQVQTFRRHASPQMEGLLADGQKVIETHVATLKRLMAELDKSK